MTSKYEPEYPHRTLTSENFTSCEVNIISENSDVTNANVNIYNFANFISVSYKIG